MDRKIVMGIVSKKQIKQSLLRLGVSAVPARNVRPIDLRKSECMDPVKAAYYSGGRDVIFRVPLTKCITFDLTAFPAVTNGASPFIKTINDYRSERAMNYCDSALSIFYSMYKPRSAAELFGLENPSYSELLRLPPCAAFFVWRSVDIHQLLKIRNRQIAQDNEEHGSKLPYQAGDPFYGPVWESKGELEFSRLVKVADSINKHGHRIDLDGLKNINVVALVDRSQWRIVICNSGQHRTAALAALGYENIVVQLKISEGLGGVVRRSDVSEWPAVREGLLDSVEALSIFDRIFYGRQPSIANQWLSAVETL